jgi:hypothetical protein
MSQIFHPSTNTFAKVSIFGAVFFLAILAGIGLALSRSDYATGAGVVKPQPVQFSHEHHVGGLGIDCRYCHASVEVSSFAGMPSTQTCMTCHSQIWNDSPKLARVRASYATNVPIAWNRVHDLPDFVYFNHSMHVTKGVGCTECHGQVDKMPLMWQAAPLTMEWCLGCHRTPADALRPVDAVFDMSYEHPPNQVEVGEQLLDEYHIPVERLTDCYTCHR